MQKLNSCNLFSTGDNAWGVKMNRRLSNIAIVAFLAAFAASPANAEAVYTYTGLIFGSTTVAQLNASANLTIILDMATALGDNQTNITITPTHFSFSDTLIR